MLLEQPGTRVSIRLAHHTRGDQAVSALTAKEPVGLGCASVSYDGSIFGRLPGGPGRARSKQAEAAPALAEDQTPHRLLSSAATGCSGAAAG